MRSFSDSYLDLLTGEFKELNLTRILEPEEFYQKQIIDSLLPIEEMKCFKNLLNERALCLDIGFGGGFPIVPLAKSFPDVQFMGFEARRKKADAVREIASTLGLTNAQFFHKRIETIHIDKSCVITFKAVGKISEYLRKLNPSVPVTVVFYKGPKLDELEDFSQSKLPKGWKQSERVDLSLSGTEGRTLIAFEFQNVPRGTNKLKKNLANLSELI